MTTDLQAAFTAFTEQPNPNRMHNVIKIALAQWDIAEIGDENLADYLDTVSGWLRHNDLYIPHRNITTS